MPTFALVPSDVAGVMEALGEFPSAFHACLARREPRAHVFDERVGPCRKRERTSIEPMALHVAGGPLRGLQRLLREVRWDEAQMRWHDQQLVADALGDS